MAKPAALLREPLLHFVVGAILIFAWFYLTDSPQTSNRIVVTEADIARLQANYRQNFFRDPSEAELDGLIDAAIVEEIYFREAMKLGLDQGDPVVRRRMVTKLRFMNEQSPSDFEPDEAVLMQWLDDNADQYRIADNYAFQQIYLGEDDAVDLSSLENLLHDLNTGAVPPAQIGNTLQMLPGEVSADADELRRQFGSLFADSLDQLVLGEWVGPVRSGFGVHLVKLLDKQEGYHPALSMVRQQVLNDWRNAQLERAGQEMLDRYRSNYEIEISGRN